MSNNQPANEIKLAQVRATIWLNRDGGNAWYSITVSRSYRDGEDWKTTNSFRRDDLPLVAKATEMAYAWIWQAGTEQKEKLHAGS